MAEFDKAWAITSSWEGKLGSSKETSSDEYFNGVKWGTNYGLTGTFMKEFTAWKATDKAAFQKLTRAQCGEIWLKTRWTWNKCDQIEQQEIANLIFDWSVRRMASCVDGVRNALGQGNTMNSKGSSIIGNGDAYSVRVMNKSIGGKTTSPTDGFFILTDFAIQELNARAKLPNTNFHALLKSLRKSKDKPTTKSIIDRYDSFFNQGTPIKDEWERMRDAGVPQTERFKGTVLTQRNPSNGLPKRNLVNNQPNSPEGESEDNTVTYVLIAAGLAKLLNIW